MDALWYFPGRMSEYVKVCKKWDKFKLVRKSNGFYIKRLPKVMSSLSVYC